MADTRIAKLFNNGASQAVSLPAEFRFEGEEVYATRDELTGDVILSIRPRAQTWVEFLESVAAEDAPAEVTPAAPAAAAPAAAAAAPPAVEPPPVETPPAEPAAEAQPPVEPPAVSPDEKPPAE